MARILLDSSVWISFLTVEDLKHHEAEEIFKKHFRVSNTILVPDLILAEILNVMYRIKPDYSYQSELTQHLKDLEPIVQLVAGGEKFWFEFVPRNLFRFKLKTSDALICCYAEFLKVDLFSTFNKKVEHSFSKARP